MCSLQCCLAIGLCLLYLHVEVVQCHQDEIANQETCNVGGYCLKTWTTPVSDTNTSTVHCECQSSTSDYFVDGVSCKYADLSDGPHVIIKEGYCMTFDEESNITFMGRCPYNHINYTKQPDTLLPRDVHKLNDFMCDGNYKLSYVCGQQRREGLLCGKCQNDLGPAVASYAHQCVECHWYWPLLYLAYVFIPATMFCFFIIILRINLLSPPMNALVLLCHVLVSYANNTPCRLLLYAEQHHSSVLILSVISIYGLLNMDFLPYVLPPFCVSNKMSTLQVVVLDYVVAIYPLVFTALIYVLIEVHDRGFRPLLIIWRPFHKCLVRFRKTWNIKGSVINAFATLYVLSFTKVVSTTVSLLLTAHMVDVCGFKHPSRVYYDVSCKAFQQRHLPYGVLSIIVFICFISLPTLFFLFYSCQSVCKHCNCVFNWRLTLLHEIAKIFHQSFKDGTNGTRNCRWFAGIYLVLRITVVFSVIWRTSRQARIISSTIGLFLVAVFQPHIYYPYNCVDSFLFGGLVAIFVLLPAEQSRHITQILIYFIPLILMMIQLCWKLKSKILCFTAALQKFLCVKLFSKSIARQPRHSIEDCVTEANQPLLQTPESNAVSQTVVDIKTYGAAAVQ